MRASEDQAGEIPLGGGVGVGGKAGAQGNQIVGLSARPVGSGDPECAPKEDGYRVFPGRSVGGNLG